MRSAVHEVLGRETRSLWVEELNTCSPPELAACLGRLVQRVAQAADAPLKINALFPWIAHGTPASWDWAFTRWRAGMRDELVRFRPMDAPWAAGAPPEEGLYYALNTLFDLLRACQFSEGRWAAPDHRAQLERLLAVAFDVLGQTAGLTEPDLYRWAWSDLSPQVPRLAFDALRAAATYKNDRVKVRYTRADAGRTLLGRVEFLRVHDRDTRRRQEYADQLLRVQLSPSATDDDVRLIAQHLATYGVRATAPGVALPEQAAFGFKQAGWRPRADGTLALVETTDWPARLVPSVESLREYAEFTNYLSPFLQGGAPERQRLWREGIVRCLVFCAEHLREGVDVELGWWLRRLADPALPTRFVAAEWAETWRVLIDAGHLASPSMHRLMLACELFHQGLEGLDFGPRSVHTTAAGYQTDQQGERASDTSLIRCLRYLFDLLLAEGAAAEPREAIGMLKIQWEGTPE